MAEEFIPITVWLAGRSYRIRVRKDEEEATRRAVKLAEEKVMEMKAHYAGKDDQDFIAMTLLTYATTDLSSGATNMTILRDEIKEMSRKIDDVLNS